MIEASLPPATAPTGAPAVEFIGAVKKFGPLVALDNVSIKVEAGSVHALLGENGAGKSTLVKCLVGFYSADAGQIMFDGHEVAIRNPHDSGSLGIGMVYQHFTLVPSMTVAENLVLSQGKLPFRIDWKEETARLEEFMARMPIRVPLDKPVNTLAAGEKQRLEILKQLFLKRRLIILDEPTSVLTNEEADEALGLIRDMAHRGEITVIIITHKFREVMSFADRVSVLRRGVLVGERDVAATSPDDLGELMIGSRDVSISTDRAIVEVGPVMLEAAGIDAEDDSGRPAVHDVSFTVRGGEIVGIAGVSGNGQRELIECLLGQRVPLSGSIAVKGTSYHATRTEMLRHKVFSLPEMPLRNACVPSMSVADNMALRNFDRAPLANGPFLKRGMLRDQAKRLIEAFKVKTPSPEAPIQDLSGGNVQRAVLARELSGEVDVLIAANPVFGLDFNAVTAIHGRIVAARNRGAAVLLVSEDLDELLELADRILVMFEGEIVYQAPIAEADIGAIGRHMAGHDAGHAAAPATA
jgi:simple sugar transport system ATP-binding protein